MKKKEVNRWYTREREPSLTLCYTTSSSLQPVVLLFCVLFFASCSIGVCNSLLEPLLHFFCLTLFFSITSHFLFENSGTKKKKESFDYLSISSTWPVKIRTLRKAITKAIIAICTIIATHLQCESALVRSIVKIIDLYVCI
jgi:hypothetical protein